MKGERQGEEEEIEEEEGSGKEENDEDMDIGEEEEEEGCVWRSEGNSQRSIFSFRPVGSGIKRRSSDLVASTVTHQDSSES